MVEILFVCVCVCLCVYADVWVCPRQSTVADRAESSSLPVKGETSFLPISNRTLWTKVKHIGLRSARNAPLGSGSHCLALQRLKSPYLRFIALWWPHAVPVVHADGVEEIVLGKHCCFKLLSGFSAGKCHEGQPCFWKSLHLVDALRRQRSEGINRICYFYILDYSTLKTLPIIHKASLLWEEVCRLYK